METMITDKNLIYFLKKKIDKKNSIQEIVESILFHMVGSRMFKNIPHNEYLDIIRKEYRNIPLKIKKEYDKCQYSFTRKKKSINIILLNDKYLFEYKVLNNLSNNILINSNQRFIGSRADYYNIEQILFDDISKFYI